METNMPFSDTLSKFIKDFDCEIVEELYVAENFMKELHENDYEIRDSILYLWRLSRNQYYDGAICEQLKNNPNVDTIYIGKTVMEFGDMRQIQSIMQASYNIIPVFKQILLEEMTKYESVDGMLIDKKRHVVMAYASGLTTDFIKVPDDVIGLDNHCFNYNKFVRYITLPSSIQNIEGIVSLPNLETVVIRENCDGSYHTENGIIYIPNQNRPFFIPPFNSYFPNAEALDSMFYNLSALLRKEASKRRWVNVDADCFSIDSIFKTRKRIDLTYNGGFYQQFWTINLNEIPTRIMVEYSFYDEWLYWGDCCESDYSDVPSSDSYEYSDYNKDAKYSLRCNKCKHKRDCEAIYDSNMSYMGVLLNRLHEEVSHDFYIVDDNHIECNLNIDTPFNEIKRILLAFLDIALDLRTRYPILNKPLEQSLFHSSDFEDSMNSVLTEDYPFSFAIEEIAIGFVSEKNK